MRQYLLSLIILVVGVGSLCADTVELQSGVKIDGKVMKATDDKVFVRVAQSTFVYPRSFVSSIEITKPTRAKSPDVQRLPTAEAFLDTFVAQKWVYDIRDVPATVIDVGVLKFVPYMSYRSGNYEINIYGDPEKPAGVEIGVFKDLIDSQEAKRNCVALIEAVLAKDSDRKVLKSLELSEDKDVLDGLTFEITPPTAEDAYGGWWVSVYSEGGLDKLALQMKRLI